MSLLFESSPGPTPVVGLSEEYTQRLQHVQMAFRLAGQTEQLVSLPRDIQLAQRGQFIQSSV